MPILHPIESGEAEDIRLIELAKVAVAKYLNAGRSTDEYEAYLKDAHRACEKARCNFHLLCNMMLDEMKEKK
jgi:hypothetical protein